MNREAQPSTDVSCDIKKMSPTRPLCDGDVDGSITACKEAHLSSECGAWRTDKTNTSDEYAAPSAADIQKAQSIEMVSSKTSYQSEVCGVTPQTFNQDACDAPGSNKQTELKGTSSSVEDSHPSPKCPTDQQTPRAQRLFSRADVVTGGVLMACSGLAALGAYVMRGKDRQAGVASNQGDSDQTAGPYVVIQNHQGLIYSDLLSRVTEFDVVSDLGKNHIVIKDGSVCVSFSDCHNQVCVNAGRIKHPGSSIACLPHKLLIEVVNNPANASKMY